LKVVWDLPVENWDFSAGAGIAKSQKPTLKQIPTRKRGKLQGLEISAFVN
jgi:hypothetical protein